LIQCLEKKSAIRQNLHEIYHQFSREYMSQLRAQVLDPLSVADLLLQNGVGGQDALWQEIHLQMLNVQRDKIHARLCQYLGCDNTYKMIEEMYSDIKGEPPRINHQILCELAERLESRIRQLPS
jgi:hypothetical protein